MKTRMTPNQRKAVAASIIASGTDDLNVMFLSFSLSQIITDFSLTGSQAGLIATITNLGMLVGGMLFGYLGDRYNKMTILKLTLVIFGLATGAIYFAPNITTLYAFRFLAGIGVGGEYGVALAIISALVPAEKMGRAASLNGIAGQVGSIGSALLAGSFLSALGWRGLFLFGLLPLVIVAYLHWAIKDEPSFINQQVKNTSHSISIRRLFETPKQAYQTIVLVCMCTVQIAGYFGMMNWLPTIVQEQANLSVRGSSWWMISTILGMSLGMLVFGRLLDAVGPRIMFSVYLIASAFSVYVFTLANTQVSLLIAGAVMGFFVNGMFPGYGAMVARLYDRDIQALANNFILNIGRAVGGFSSLIIGIILESNGIPTVMISLASLYLISFSLMISLPALRPDEYFNQKEEQEILAGDQINLA